MILESKNVEHTFSIELKSKQYVKNISISNHARDLVLFEGNLGQLLELSIMEGDVLEFVGVNGILRVTLAREKLEKALRAASQVKPQLLDGEL